MLVCGWVSDCGTDPGFEKTESNCQEPKSQQGP